MLWLLQPPCQAGLTQHCALRTPSLQDTQKLCSVAGGDRQAGPQGLEPGTGSAEQAGEAGMRYVVHPRPGPLRQSKTGWD